MPLFHFLQIMKKAVINGGFEQKHAIPPYSEGKKALAKKRRVMIASLSVVRLLQSVCVLTVS